MISSSTETSHGLENSASAQAGPPEFAAVIFDLDGVLVTTDELHFQAWQQLTEAEHIPFSRSDNERLRGIGRMDSLDIVLERAKKTYTQQEKHALADRKNHTYQELLLHLSSSDVLPGVGTLLTDLKDRHIQVAVASSSRNARRILEQVGLSCSFQVVVDGNEVAKSKPAPDIFLLAAKRLGVAPRDCLVIEDAVAGIQAARQAGMPVLGIGQTAELHGADRVVPGLEDIDAKHLQKVWLRRSTT